MTSVEVVPNSTSASAPGWAYVPDTGYDPTKQKLQPSHPRKRNARIAGLASTDTTARQNAALLKHLAELDKDNSKDIAIPIPSRQKDGGARAKGKTAVTRKILLAQKTFTNYLADEEAFAAQEPHAAPAPKAKATAEPSKRASLTKTEVMTTTQAVGEQGSSSSPGNHPTFYPGVNTLSPAEMRLLETNAPSAPSAALMEALVSAPPLSFNDARAPASFPRRPVRHFCELCGYWGTIKCLLCGVRVCGLDCKKAHDEDRCQKYGA